ncbi:hypothetical protein HPB48_019772 [Haemaphysalis longicornis]|uniref:Folate receptor-like domain-containing protein n=1 Tax=Haemaphysalis longicornis TaxID=44386 RepID=A0A9J6G6Z3_HAELO|nr:hypothetical protein HPB48_019772 [Haemaphysalis longicornis]
MGAAQMGAPVFPGWGWIEKGGGAARGRHDCFSKACSISEDRAFYSVCSCYAQALTLTVSECTPWKDRACCTEQTTHDVHHKDMYSMSLDFCEDQVGRGMSDRCREYFHKDLCFYECEPNIGPWVVQGKWFAAYLEHDIRSADKAGLRVSYGWHQWRRSARSPVAPAVCAPCWGTGGLISHSPAAAVLL